MVGFKREALDAKLSSLNDSQQSIQTISLWVIHHRKHYKEIVHDWLEHLKKETRTKKLTFVYLANDVIQNSRKKVPQYAKEFLKALPLAFENIAKDVDEKIKGKIERVINIWGERAIYEKKDIDNFLGILARGNIRPSLPNGGTQESRQSTSQNSTLNHSQTLTPVSSGKKRKADDGKTPSGEKKTLLDELDDKSMKAMMQKILRYTAAEIPTLSPDDRAERIDSERLMKSLKMLENCPSNDPSMKSRISGLPSEVYDVSLIEETIKREGNSSSDKWLKTVDEAQRVLVDYNKKLAQEIEERTNSLTMLAKFAERTTQELRDAQLSLGENKEKLRKCLEVRQELGSHIASLPDLSQLPSLALPSAVDLFHSKHSA